MIQRHPRLLLAFFLLINIIAYIDRSMLLGFSPQITRDLSLSNTQYGFLSGMVWVFSYSAMVVVFGALADRVSRTRLIAVGMLIWSACTAASGMAEDFGHMVAARLIVASGEAALVPSATALLADLFDAKGRSSAHGLFFTGIPLGISLSYVLSGTVGADLGWRHTFLGLGVLGVACAVPLWFIKDTLIDGSRPHTQGQRRTAAAILRELADRPAVIFTILGVVLVHLAMAEVSFLQLWLVRERGADPAELAQRIGGLQILFGCLGAAGGGWCADRLAAKSRKGLALLPVLLLAICVPIMFASRFVPLHNPILYAGIAAQAFLSFGIYGGSFALIQGGVPSWMRSTAVGITMMLLNIFAISFGGLVAGYLSDLLARAGNTAPLTLVLAVMDLFVGLAIPAYLAAAKVMPKTLSP